MYVSKLEISGIRGFEGHREVNLDFARESGTYAGWTVLAGRNGSGKTTLLQAIALALTGQYFVRDIESWRGSHSTINSWIRVTVLQDQIFDGGLDFGPWTFELRWDEPGNSYPEPKWADYGGKRRAPKNMRFANGDGWFYAGYGPFRRLSSAALGGHDTKSHARYAGLRTLFDEDVSLIEGVSWLVEQHLYRLEKKPGAEDLLDTVLTLLGDGMLPDGYRICRVDSDGLWVRRGSEEFALRQMSDGYRTVTALVVDIIRQMHLAYGRLRLEESEGVYYLAYPGVVLIDEIEAHLHVSWQKKIGEWLKIHFPAVQFLVTTHSPYICQSADSNGLVRLPAPEEPESPKVVDLDLYERVVYGSGDDAVLTDLFGVDTPYSTRAEEMRRRLGNLETKVLAGTASPAEIDEYQALSETLTSSLTARVDEVPHASDAKSDSRFTRSAKQQPLGTFGTTDGQIAQLRRG
ncbi:AAA family ATPase [Sphaerisporangium sp. NPDC051017]|uniref:AAA family ATPase n=1 Tax=Sphaerisporangium sp. NPDC051017 TaxID=3154636 RepID=UPI003414C074